MLISRCLQYFPYIDKIINICVKKKKINMQIFVHLSVDCKILRSNIYVLYGGNMLPLLKSQEKARNTF